MANELIIFKTKIVYQNILNPNMVTKFKGCKTTYSGRELLSRNFDSN